MKALRKTTLLLCALGLAAYAGCSSKSPTEPSPTPANPKVPVPAASLVVNVSANPGQLSVGSSNSSNITITVRRSDNGAPPPDGTVVNLTTTLGSFGSLGGPSQVTAQLVGGQTQAVLFAGTSAGTATVTATVTASDGTTGTGAASVHISQASTFFLSSVVPNTGNPSGGDQVTINGGGFIAPVRVTFNGTAAQVVSVGSSQLKVITPSAVSVGVTVGVGQAVPVTVAVSNNLNGPTPGQDSLTNGFTYTLASTGGQMAILSVSPSSGPDNGGTRVTITGQGFQAPVQVFFGSSSGSGFNGVEASVVSVTANQIVAITPPARGFGQSNVNKQVDVMVKNVSTGFTAVLPGAFTYGSSVLITSVAPSEQPYNQQVRVTVFGQGFQDPVAVSLAGFAATVLSTSGSEIQVLSSPAEVSGCADVKGAVHVTNINTGDSADGPSYTYQVQAPAISGINPASGSSNGGTLVTISGINFTSPIQVLFGQSAGQGVTVNSPTSITVTAPPFTGTFPTQTCTGAGGVQGTQNLPTSVDVVVQNPVTTCTNTLKQAFTYLPADLSCHVVITKPSSSFTFAKAGLKVAFTDTSSGSPTSFLWDFGDATTSTNENPVHTYAVAGTYLVTFTVSNSAGSSTSSQSITVP